MKIYINSIDYEGSTVDGPGVRTVVFLQGCNRHCEGCHNQSTWDKNCGTKYEVTDLANELKKKVKNKKVTISGGEPFFQPDATCELIRQLDGFDICVYTGSEYEEIKRDFENILPLIHYLKVGKYKKELRTTMIPYVGSSNQRFLTLREGEINE